jgi:hypothetical protein
VPSELGGNEERTVSHVVNEVQEWCRLQNWNVRFLFATEMPVDHGSSGRKVENPMVQPREAQLQQKYVAMAARLGSCWSVRHPPFSTNLCSDHPSNLGSHGTSHTLAAS